ncbi:MAG: MoaD/ThiS family protein [Candidatus Methylomirabilales bacterium]
MTVHLHTTLQRETPAGRLRRLEVALTPASTLADLLAKLEVAADPEWTLFVVNGRQAAPAQALQDGDEVHLIPALAGG